MQAHKKTQKQLIAYRRNMERTHDTETTVVVARQPAYQYYPSSPRAHPTKQEVVTAEHQAIFDPGSF